MNATSKLSSNFQIAIPQTVCEQQRWKPGQEFVFVSTENGVLIVPAVSLEDLRGIAKGADPTGYRDRDDRY
jgi:bifunctional DNA-binding transcriptional regulator/antitoxin component of YhaV-PrlF toxin-antitoxin module